MQSKLIYNERVLALSEILRKTTLEEKKRLRYYVLAAFLSIEPGNPVIEEKLYPILRSIIRAQCTVPRFFLWLNLGCELVGYTR